MGTHDAAINSVHIYNDSSDLISRLCEVFYSSLKVGDAVLIVATAHHRERLVNGLRETGIELREHAREGRYTMIDADEMLSTFMVNGTPDSGPFRTSVGGVLAKARKAARSKAQGLMVFGEMVAVLWDKGAKDAALQLEALWNHALHHHAFHLHCAYPRWGFINADDEVAVCAAHSHLVVQ